MLNSKEVARRRKAEKLAAEASARMSEWDCGNLSVVSEWVGKRADRMLALTVCAVERGGVVSFVSQFNRFRGN